MKYGCRNRGSRKAAYAAAERGEMDKILVTGENRKYYTDLVPADMVHMMYETEYITVGGYETEGETAFPAAVMIVSKNGKELAINWLYVAEDKRNLGYGGDLVDYAFELAEENSLPRVAAMIRRTEAHNMPGDPVDYFLSFGFGIVGTSRNEWLVTPGEITEKIAPLVKDTSAVSSLSEQPASVLKARLKEVGERIGEDSIPFIDKDVSCVYTKNGKVVASVLVKNIGGIYVPVDYHSETGNPACLPVMMVYAAGKIVEQSGEDAYVYAKFVDEKWQGMAKSILAKSEPLVHDILKATINIDAIEEKAYEQWLESERKRLEELEAIPEVAEVINIEYFSGVVVDEA